MDIKRQSIDWSLQTFWVWAGNVGHASLVCQCTDPKCPKLRVMGKCKTSERCISRWFKNKNSYFPSIIQCLWNRDPYKGLLQWQCLYSGFTFLWLHVFVSDLPEFRWQCSRGTLQRPAPSRIWILCPQVNVCLLKGGKFRDQWNRTHSLGWSLNLANL